MSLQVKAVRGAIWTITGSLGTRVIGLVGTLVLTRFISPEIFGELTVAQVIVLTASIVTSFGLGQYVVAHPKAGRAAIFHATLVYEVAGLLALGLVLLLREPLAASSSAPGMRAFLPGLALAMAIERLSLMPERILVRDMRFHVVSLERSAGELAYTAAAVGLAAIGWGGMAIVVGSVTRSVLRAGICIFAVDHREWIEAHRLDRERLRDLMRFGLPLSIGNIAHVGAANWDNWLMSYLFGPGVAGVYKFAYNIADIPATHVGEQIGDVLLPSFAHMTQEQRRAALPRAMGILGLVVFPLAVGLGAVAHTVVAALLDPKWQAVAPMLVILSMLSVTRPVGWVVSSYLQAQRRTRAIMILEVTKALGIVVFLLAVGRFGPLWACAAAGATYGAHALASAWVVRRLEGVGIAGLLAPLLGPFLACVPMVAAVLGTRLLLSAQGVGPKLTLPVELLAGAVAYVGAALLIAPGLSREMFSLIRRALSRRKKRASEPPSAASPRQRGVGG